MWTSKYIYLLSTPNRFQFFTGMRREWLSYWHSWNDSTHKSCPRQATDRFTGQLALFIELLSDTEILVNFNRRPSSYLEFSLMCRVDDICYYTLTSADMLDTLCTSQKMNSEIIHYLYIFIHFGIVKDFLPVSFSVISLAGNLFFIHISKKSCSQLNEKEIQQERIDIQIKYSIFRNFFLKRHKNCVYVVSDYLKIAVVLQTSLNSLIPFCIRISFWEIFSWGSSSCKVVSFIGKYVFMSHHRGLFIFDKNWHVKRFFNTICPDFEVT